MNPRLSPRFLLLLPGMLSLLFALAGCRWNRPLLYDVRFEPNTTITPNADSLTDVTQLHYSIRAPALVTIAIENEAGERYLWREREPRAPGKYEAWYSGVVDGRVLPDGRYRFVVIAESTEGVERVEEQAELVVEEADTTPLEILNFSVTPRTISPNNDGIRDEAAITYALSREVERVDVFLLGPDGERYHVPPDDIRDPTAAGGHTHRYDGGAGLRAVPPPDGTYTVVAEAFDRVGASARVSATLTLENGGLPQVEITRHNVDFSTEVLTLGETLFFTTTVTNVGTTAIRTHGPEPGTVYDSTENYNNYGEPIEDGAWRLGLDFEGNPVYNGRRYPYRWQLGTSEQLTKVDGELYLMPGDEVTITGGLRLLEMPPREASGFWIGLIHENVRFVEDFVGTSYITIEGRPDAPGLLATPTAGTR